MNLYEYEGKRLFAESGIAIPKGKTLFSFEEADSAYQELGSPQVVLKAQVLSGKRGKAGAIRFCSDRESVIKEAATLFSMSVNGQQVVAVHMEEKLAIASETYLSVVWDTNKKQPVLVYSSHGGMDIEDVEDGDIIKIPLDVRERTLSAGLPADIASIAEALYHCFLDHDCRVAEINPLVKTPDGVYIAADAKIAIDDDAFFRHQSWATYPVRTMMGRLPTDREVAVAQIDQGEDYYRGTAGKYIEMDGDIAILFSGGGASIANMDALISQGLRPANYTEYSGNPPREKVHALTKIVLSKPGLRGLWIAGGVANFTNIEETFHGIVDALDEVQPRYPIVVRRAGPKEKEGMELMRACAERNGLHMTLLGKETSMSESAAVLAQKLA